MIISLELSDYAVNLHRPPNTSSTISVMSGKRSDNVLHVLVAGMCL